MLAALTLSAGCKPKMPEDTPQAAFARWTDATARRDVEAYFDAVIPPNRTDFLMNIVASWRAGEWQSVDPSKHEVVGAMLRRMGLDSIAYPLSVGDRLKLDSIPSIPGLLAQIVDAVGEVGPRGVPMWDLLPQPISLGTVGAVD
jgi:hypothetical protein